MRTFRTLPSALIIGLFATFCGPLTGCDKDSHANTPLDYSENAKRDYDAAMEAFDDKNWEGVNQMMNEVRRKYGYSRYARLAELRLAFSE